MTVPMLPCQDNAVLAGERINGQLVMLVFDICATIVMLLLAF